MQKTKMEKMKKKCRICGFFTCFEAINCPFHNGKLCTKTQGTQ